jgi:sarcosine oxidase subunit beta
VFPALADVELLSAEAERAEGIAIDMLPIVDRLPGLESAWVATGWSGHGWAIAPAVADLMAAWMLTGDRPPELAPFGLSRS